MGHSAGKTLFCRLLRFALGERDFGDPDLRREVHRLVPDGWVGVEVEVAGLRWVALRSLRSRGAAKARCGGTLDALFAAADEEVPYARFLEAIEHSLPPLPRKVQSSIGELRWPTTLAWLSRDQERHFLGLRDWRARWTLSRKEPTLTWLSNFMRANLRLRSDGEEGAYRKQSQKLRERRANIMEVRSVDEAERIARVFGLISSQDFGPLFEQAHLRTAVPSEPRAAVPNTNDLIAAVQAHASAIARLDSIQRRILDANKRHEKAVRNLIHAQARGTALREMLLKLTKCPKCGWRWDRWNQSGRATDLVEVAPSQIEDELRGRDAEEQEWREEAQCCRDELAQLQSSAVECKRDVDRFLKDKNSAQARHDVASADFVAQQRHSAVEERERSRQLEWFQKVAVLREQRGALDHALKALKVDLEAARSSQAAAIGRLDNTFDGVIRALLDDDATGVARLRKQNIECDTYLDGRRRSAAIDALNVIAFDLAAMVLAGEGHASLPTWLLHDSPRTADLAASNYGRLFELIVRLEQATAGEPWFQYIITTTSPPPERFCGDEYVKLRLNGAAPSGRLLMTPEPGEAA